jgi:hypothetical protein
VRISDFGRHALSICAAAAFLAGCGGSQPPIGAPSAIPQSQTSAIARHAAHGESWMASNAQRQSLVYVADAQTADVYVYSYPKGILLQTLTGFQETQGECADKNSNVFITDLAPYSGSSKILEYARGGSAPIATFNDPGYGERPWSCAVDSTTGNLAVTNVDLNHYPNSDLVVYPSGSSTPITYTNIPYLTVPYYCVYDDKGDLFVAGQYRVYQFGFDELRKGSSGFVHIRLEHRPFVSPDSAIQWDGKYIVIGGRHDYVTQYLIHGLIGTKAAEITLDGASILSFWLQGKRLVVSNGQTVTIYSYPVGGTALKTLTGFGDATAAVVSVAPAR